jgi:hypothetical protein
MKRLERHQGIKLAGIKTGQLRVQLAALGNL